MALSGIYLVFVIVGDVIVADSGLYSIDITQGLGRIFYGIGGLSAGVSI